MKNICIVHVQYCNKQSTPYEQVDALETGRTEENHTTKKQNLTSTATKNYVNEDYLTVAATFEIFGNFFCHS